ncbi:uracil nucleotide/cysteinyl leukotriene receptor-like [Puntigrus tetrazona]|uniref:uracil nucleotide/cysteinyl leukotriene receptor-like n=1 Tax=Puntigrus tetrazona TaxID=1606681 RepID=UPI001C8B00A2|nr:uracil nucleotide/cysteinyl leukotriene receptor-like [Puntigrus tetrazona]XP_043114492.1 uracil nucleotide/cysteinyl leukotriene receptor-like [Puntigrus tetrazona]
MNYSTVNFMTPETNHTTQSITSLKSLDIFLYSIGFLFGLPTHSYIIWLIVRGTGSGVASEFFNLNLSICEIANSLNGLIAVLSFHLSSLWILSNFLQGVGITGRPLFQCLICVERYLAVVHPVTFLKYKPLRYRVICCTVVWIIILGSCLVCLNILLNIMVAYPWFFSLQFLVFLSIQLFCLVAVLRALKQSGPGERGRERKEENHMKRKAFDLVLITTGNLVIIYVPLTITGFFYITMKNVSLPLWVIGVVSYILAGFVQPVLYLHRAGKLSCLCCS